jgi:hypothetical protein
MAYSYGFFFNNRLNICSVFIFFLDPLLINTVILTNRQQVNNLAFFSTMDPPSP